MNDKSKSLYLSYGLKTISMEIKALQLLHDNLDDKFIKTCKTILACQGHIIMLGIGKSGHIASKIASTFASTGTPSFFIHPAEAGHGDFGMITKKDIIFTISNSGNTSELISLIPMIKKMNIPLIVITNQKKSILAKAANIILDLGITKEACPLNLSPTSTATTSLVLGDAIAITLLQARKFTKQDFANLHPSGSLGKKLLLTIKCLMHSGKNIPIVSPKTTIEDTISEMSIKALGVCFICDKNNLILGVFTDGDVRRVFQSKNCKGNTLIKEVMSLSPKTINENTLAIDAIEIMNRNKITTIAVINNCYQLTGVIHIHDLVRTGII